MYDVIVLGTGGVGSAALYHLARRGLKVLGLDRFAPAHDRGSSHGQTRVIRQAYFEHPDYVPLLLRSYELWRDLSERCGKQLYHETGLLQVGPNAGQVLSGVREAARVHGLDIENFSAQAAMLRFPAFNIPETWEAMFERRAGYLDVEDCVRAHLQEAQKLGAELRTNVSVSAWQASGEAAVEVVSDAGTFRAAKLIVAAGAWSGQLLSDLGLLLNVVRKPMFWYPANAPALHVAQGCPVYLFETPTGVFYGFPQLDALGVKVARHTGGDLVNEPLRVDRTLDMAEQTAVEAFMARHLPGVSRPLVQHLTCMYTMSADSNFIVDLHPQYSQVAFAAGLSGHGFKFTCVLGEALADLATQGRTTLPIGFLNCQRPGLLIAP